MKTSRRIGMLRPGKTKGVKKKNYARAREVLHHGAGNSCLSRCKMRGWQQPQKNWRNEILRKRPAELRQVASETDVRSPVVDIKRCRLRERREVGNLSLAVSLLASDRKPIVA